MKILVLMGSPRHGDGYKLCRAIEAKLQTLGEAKVTYRFLKEAHIEYCRGCMLCVHKGEEHCPIKDDVATIWQEMAEADGVIFDSPVYAHGITGLLKNFIDRSCFLFHRPRFFDKAALTVTTTAFSGLKETTDYLQLTARAWGFNLVGSLEALMVPYEQNPRYKARVHDELDALATKFYAAMETKTRPAPSIFDLVFFGSMKMKAARIPHDREYWTKMGWMDRDYFLDVPIPWFNRLIARRYLRKAEKEAKRYFS